MEKGKKYMAKSVHRVPYLRVQIMILKQWLEECFDSIPIKIVWFFLQITLLIIPYTWDFQPIKFFFNPPTLKISSALLLTVCHTVLAMLVWTFFFILITHLVKYCIGIVRRNSVLVTHGIWGVKVSWDLKFSITLFSNVY